MSARPASQAGAREGSYQPVIIIGGGRSGTNILRDVLSRLPSCGTWPCDEINYIWRHGNARYPDDELSEEQATTSVRAGIRRSFELLARKHGLSFVIEKTCANSLRIPFVDRVFPDAKYVFVVRDGRDAVASAMKRWVAPLDLPYILAKARYVPPADVPWYAARYLWNRIRRVLSRDKRLSFWGPRFQGMEKMRSRSLAEVCAVQWVRCVERSEQGFAEIEPGCVHRLRYETFATSPSRELGRLIAFLGVEAPECPVQDLVSDVSSSSLGKWRHELSRETVEIIMPVMEALLKRYDYV